MKTLLIFILLAVSFNCNSQVLLGKTLGDIYTEKGSSYNTYYFKTPEGKDTDSAYIFILDVYKGSDVFYMRNGVCYRQEYISCLERLKTKLNDLNNNYIKQNNNVWLGKNMIIYLKETQYKFIITYKPKP